MSVLKNLLFSGLVAGCAGLACPSVEAFMMDGAEAVFAGKTDITQTVDGLRQELKAGETTCEVLLEKIDTAISDIDKALDTGVSDENKYMGLRDELVEMRLTLPCLATELADVMGESIIGEQVIGESVLGGDSDLLGGFVPFGDGGCPGCGTAGGGYSGGGFSSGGGGLGGGGLGGGGGLLGGGIGGPLLLGGIAAAIAIPVALGNNDDPGANATVAN